MLIHVTTSQQAKYNTYYNAYTPRIIAVIHKFMGEFLKEFDLTEDVNILIRPIRQKIGANTHGLCGRFSKIEVDCRQGNIRTIVNTLAHELTHAEQYQSKRLEHKWVPELEETRDFWSGEMTAEEIAYRERPWEIEAFARADEFCLKYADKIAEYAKEFGQ